MQAQLSREMEGPGRSANLIIQLPWIPGWPRWQNIAGKMIIKCNASRIACDCNKRNVCWIISQLDDTKIGGLPAKTAKSGKN